MRDEGTWRTSDVVAHAEMRDLAAQLIARLDATRQGADPDSSINSKVAHIRDEIREIDAWNRADVERLTEDLRRRLQQSEHST